MGTKKSRPHGKYITIAEYADIRGVTTPAVYKRLEKALKPWYREINGKKYLLSSVLYEEGKADVSEIDETEVTEEETEVNEYKTRYIEELRAQIAHLQTENEAQRAAIKEKEAAIKEKDAKLIEFAEKFAELANQAQQLHAAQTMIEAKSAAAAEDAPAEPETKKRGFFARLLFPD